MLPVVASEERKRLPLAPQARDIDLQWRPIYAVWEVTLRCDLACRHCGSRAGRAREDELTTAEALDVVRQLAELGVKEVTLIGGEAYLRSDWTDIIRSVRDHGMACSVTTGGRFFTAERARAGKDAGLRAVSVSVDGLRATHDELRGVAGSFDAALAALGAIRDAGLTTMVNTQVNRRNWRELGDVCDVLSARGVTSWMVQLTTAMGRAADEPGLLIEPYQLLDLMPRLVALQDRGRRSGLDVWPGNNLGYFGPHEATLRSSLPDKHSGACGAGRVTLGLEANGDVKGCPSLPSQDYVGGNVRSESLLDIWERSSQLGFTRARSSKDLWGFCASCYYADSCLGGCNWTTHVLFGRIGNNPLCHHRAMVLQQAGRRERLVQTAVAPGLPFDHGLFEIVEEPWPADGAEGATV